MGWVRPPHYKRFSDSLARLAILTLTAQQSGHVQPLKSSAKGLVGYRKDTVFFQLAALHARPGNWNLGTIYELFPRLYARRNARGDVLSGGEQQMLAIARALIQNPEVFLMDEPSEGLSPAIVQEVGHLIRRLNREGVSILLVEQKLAFALQIVDRIIIMNKGAVVYSGKPADIAHDPDIGVRFLGMGVTSAREDGAA